MTQEDKQLLLKDLCARLLYKTYLWTDRASEEPIIMCSIYCDANDSYIDVMVDDGLTYEVEDVKPYLRPMSSMTEDEEGEFEETLQYTQYTLESYDWLNAHNFDYRGLIDKGLALEAPEGMYKTE